MSWNPLDFGANVPGLSGLTATGTTQAGALPLPRKVNVFSTVPSGAGAVLPSAYSPGAELRVLNRGANNLSVYPPLGDQVENYGVNTPVAVAPGGNAYFVSFDPPLAPKPRTWWLALLALMLSLGIAQAQPVVVGPLQIQNHLSEIAAGGTSAQQAARANLGISSSGTSISLPNYTIATLPAVTSANAGLEAWATDCKNGAEGSGTGCVYTVNTLGSWTPNPSVPTLTMTIGGQSLRLGGSTTNQGNGSKLQLSTGSFVNGHCLQFDVNGNATDSGGSCGGGGGSGTVNSATAGAIAYFAANGTAVSGTSPAANSVLVTNGSSAPSLATTLPSGLTIPAPTVSGANLTGTTTAAILTASGKVTAPASTTSAAGINIGQGTAPSSPVNGDVWITGGIGLQYRVGGATATPVASLTATSPVGVSGTGSLTVNCATCVTSSGGGAMTATAPMTVSSAGLIALGSQPGSAMFQWPTAVAVAADTYYATISWPWATGTITSVQYATGGSGTPSFAIAVQINGTNVTGCNGITVNSATVTSSTCTAANTVTTGQKVTLVVSSISGVPSAAQVQIKYTRSAN